MKDTYIYTGIGAVIGLFLGQLVVAFVPLEIPFILGPLTGMVIGIGLGFTKDRDIHKQIKERDYTISDIKRIRNKNKYRVTIVDNEGAEDTFVLTREKFKANDFKIGSPVYLTRKSIALLPTEE